MRHDFLRKFHIRLVALPIAVLVLATSGRSQQLQASLDEAAIRSAIEPAQTAVRLLGVSVEQTAEASHRITIDLSQKALTYDPSGDVELFTDHVLASTARLTAGAREVEYRFLVEGLPLDRFLPTAVQDR